MKRIKNATQLQLEREKLAHHRLLLEEDIRHNWKELLHHFEPGVFARDAFFSGLSWIGNRLLAARDRAEKTHRKF
jgi:hypothetical protein